ncbi:hypothetical protein J6590_081057 [Homalodisca vitripennis]|nr:hypothetical protein J6590_100579 [Homalodisca vitripennis]KAG8319917.1 hypothetical protein J6590_081057 [Homalodisca vitripennis]
MFLNLKHQKEITISNCMIDLQLTLNTNLVGLHIGFCSVWTIVTCREQRLLQPIRDFTSRCVSKSRLDDANVFDID